MPDNNADQPPTDTARTPAEVFALVGHEIRAEIIWVLGDPDNDEWELSFGELRERMVTDVEPSRLHYHLKQLVGHFVAKSDDGYHLRPEGVHLCWALRTGSFSRHQERVSVDAEFDCYYCQTPVEACFADGIGKLECPECESIYVEDLLDFSVEAFEDGTVAFSHFRKYMILKNFFLAHGVCPSCAHPVRPAFHSREGHHGNVCIHPTCDFCGVERDLSVGRALLADPELIAFCYDHGADVLSTPWWELEFAATDKHVTVRSTEPWEVALAVTLDDETLELVVDGDLNVTERNCRDASDGNGVSLPDKEACLEHLRRQRWPDVVTCPHCDSADTIKKGTTGKGTKRYQCHNCDSIFNDLTGTMFAGHQLSLPEMIQIIREMDGSGTAGIVRDLDRSYPSILDFVDEVQEARDEGADGILPAIGEADNGGLLDDDTGSK